MKKLVWGLLAALLLSLILLYFFSKQLLLILVENQLPPQWKVVEFEIQRPNWQGLSIDKISLQNNHQRLAISQTQLNIEWWNGSLQTLSIGTLSGTLEPAQLSRFKSPPPKNKEIEIEPPLSYSNLPLSELTIKQLDIQFHHSAMDPIRVHGEVQFNNAQWSAELDVTELVNESESGSARNHRLIALSLKTLANNQLVISGYANLHAKQWQVFRSILPFAQPLPEWTQGNIQGQFKSTLDLSDLPQSTAEVQLSLQEIQLLIDTQKIAQLQGNLAVHYDRGQLQVSQFQANGHLTLSQTISHLKQSNFEFQLNGEKFLFEQNALKSKFEFVVDQKHKATFDLAIELNDSLKSHQSIELKFSSLDQTLSDLLTGVSIDALQTRIEFSVFQKQGDWLLDDLTISPIVIQNVAIKQPIATHIESITAVPKWQTNQPISIHAIQESNDWINAIDVNIQNLWQYLPDHQLQHRANSQIMLKFLAGGMTIDGQFFSINPDSPTITNNKNAALLINRSRFAADFNSQYQLTRMSSQLDFTVHRVSQLFLAKPWVKPKLIKQIKLFSIATSDATKTADPNSTDKLLTDTLNIEGELEMVSENNNTFLLQGELQSKIARLSVLQHQLSDLRFTMSWDELSKWHQFKLDTEFDAHYQSQDQQTHRAQVVVDLGDEIRFKSLEWHGQVLGGKASISTNSDYQTLADSSGVLELAAIDLAKVSNLMDKPELKLSGKLKGQVPFSLRNHQLYLQDGHLQSELGVIQYLPEGKKKVLTKENMSDLANISLQNFHYAALKATVVRGNPCEFDIQLRLEGKNPDLGPNANQIFNIHYNPRSNINLYHLMLLGEDFIKQMQTEKNGSVCVHLN